MKVDLCRDQGGATALEWTLLLGAIAIPSYVLIALGLATLAGHYRLVSILNALPFP
jgi:Flp pilus assembly pilin Flp